MKKNKIVIAIALSVLTAISCFPAVNALAHDESMDSEARSPRASSSNDTSQRLAALNQRVDRLIKLATARQAAPGALNPVHRRQLETLESQVSRLESLLAQDSQGIMQFSRSTRQRPSYGAIGVLSGNDINVPVKIIRMKDSNGMEGPTPDGDLHSTLTQSQARDLVFEARDFWQAATDGHANGRINIQVVANVEAEVVGQSAVDLYVDAKGPGDPKVMDTLVGLLPANTLSSSHWNVVIMHQMQDSDVQSVYVPGERAIFVPDGLSGYWNEELIMAHEFGHSFSLQHKGGSTGNLMNLSNMNSTLDSGQLDKATVQARDVGPY